MLSCAAGERVNILLRLLAPAALLGAVLLLGERQSGPPDETPAAEMSAASWDLSERPEAAPCLASGASPVVLRADRLPPSSVARLSPSAPPPEARSLSPPRAA